MSFPGLETQQFTEKTLKGFLLKNVDQNTQNPSVMELNHFLVKRVDEFWDQVVVPLKKAGKFDGNKINWYFEIYKEGLDSRKMGSNPFIYIQVTEDQIRELVTFFEDKSLRQYLALGTSFLSNSFSVLSSWMRDQMVYTRLEHIYSSENPYDWIIRAEEEENGIMKQKPDKINGLLDVVNNIGLIMSRRY